MKIHRIIRIILVVVVCLPLLTLSNFKPADPVERVRAFTRWQEFDFITWTLDALLLKNTQAAANVTRYLDEEQQKKIVYDYIDQVRNLQSIRDQIESIYADPNVQDPELASAALRANQQQLQEKLSQWAPLAEAVIQHQVAVVVGEMGLGPGRQPLPPPLYHVTPLPMALIVSPRDAIRQDVDISLMPDLSVEEMNRLESSVEKGLNVSALVVPVGGIGIYPTMVMETTNLNWLIEVVAHEWTHNYLTLRPLGVLYYQTPELRIINETTASIAGKELSQAVIARFYPERLPAPPRPVPYENLYSPPDPEQEEQQPSFDYRAEMHETRLTVDALLAEGKIEQAEEYMEARRRFFWDNGYQIRRINQAYFAFYGAYADSPGGAAGRDPVSAAVRILRAESLSLDQFLKRISWVTSFERLAQMTGAK